MSVASPIYNYEIAVGWNNSGSTTNIEAITPTGAATTDLIQPVESYYLVRGVGGYDEPMIATVGGAIVRGGFERVRWLFFVQSILSYSYFYNTYFRDSTELGKVTIRTRLNATDNAYSYVNARLNMPRPQSLAVEYENKEVLYTPIELDYVIFGTAS